VNLTYIRTCCKPAPNNPVSSNMNLTPLILCFATLSVGLHAQAPATPAQPRLLCLFLDLNSMDAADQSTAKDNAIKFVQEQAAPSDRISVMTYTSQLNVLQDFTDSRDGILAALRTIMPADAGANATGASARLQAIQAAVSLLAALPEKKAMVYFSSGIPKSGIDSQEQLRATTNAAVRANVAIYSVDSRDLVAAPK
jgi:VWFA-related protein